MIPIPVSNRALLVRRAVYALTDHNKLAECFRRVFAECEFHPQKNNDAEIVYFPGGILDRVMSAYTNASVSGHYSLEKFMDADVFAVRFLTSGNPLVTGLALAISSKIRWFNESKQKVRVERFLSVASRMINEYGIQFVDFDDWNEFISSNPRYRASSEWDSKFLYNACPKFRATVLTKMGLQE